MPPSSRNHGCPETNSNARRWLRWSCRVRGAFNGLGIAVPMATLAFWMGTRWRADVGYNIALGFIGYFLAVLLLRRSIDRKLQEITRREGKLASMREVRIEGVAPSHQLDVSIVSSELTTRVRRESDARQRLENWLTLIDKYNRTLFRIGRWICGMSCIGAAITVFIGHRGEHSWGGSLLLATGGILLGAPTVLESLKPLAKRPRSPRNLKKDQPGSDEL